MTAMSVFSLFFVAHRPDVIQSETNALHGLDPINECQREMKDTFCSQLTPSLHCFQSRRISPCNVQY